MPARLVCLQLAQRPTLENLRQWLPIGLASVSEPADLAVASDDWPFLYLRRPMIPYLSLRGAIIKANGDAAGDTLDVAMDSPAFTHQPDGDEVSYVDARQLRLLEIAIHIERI